MLKIADNSDFPKIYELVGSKNKIFETSFGINRYEDFCTKLSSSDSIKIFLNFDDDVLNGILFTRSIVKVFPAWYSHLIITRTGLKLKTSHTCQAQLYDCAIEFFETNQLTTFFYIQPIRYERFLNTPVRQYSQKLKLYSSIVVEHIEAKSAPTSLLTKSLLNDRLPAVDVRVVMKVKKDNILYDSAFS